MDRDRDRDRDRRFDNRERDRNLGGESYRPPKHPDNTRRPSRSPPVRSGAFRPSRPSQRRSRSPVFDTYAPSGRAGTNIRDRSPVGYRHRSRSPPPPRESRERERSPLTGPRRGRERSPARRPSPRRVSRTRDGPPRRDERARSPPRNPRGRSPPPKREREPSLVGTRGGRSPQPFKREIYNSPPRGGYDRQRSPPRRQVSPPRGRTRDLPRMRSRSPVGDDRAAHYTSASRRARSISPARPNHSGQTSGKESGNTSRRSSPPIHPSRLALHQTGSHSPPHFPSGGGRPPHPAPRSPITRSPRHDRDRSPPRRGYSPRRSPRRSPPRGPAGYRSPLRRGYSPPPVRAQAPQRNGSGANGPSHQFSTPAGNSYRNDHSDRNDHQKETPRAPPTGPSRNFSSPALISPPSGPSSTPISMSAHNRIGSQSVLSAPTHPRGTPSSGPQGQRTGSFSGPPPSGPRRGPPPLITRDSPRVSSATPTPTASSPGTNSGQNPGIPTGPRAPPPSSRTPHIHPHSSSGFRPGHHNSTSTTYPRTQRFNPHLSGLPTIAHGGKLFPAHSGGGDPAIAERLTKLQQEQQKIERELAEKLDKKRKSVRQWEKLDRESAREGLKGELAEKQVRMMAGEGGLGGAAF